MARPPRPDTFADAPSSWAPLSDEAGSDEPGPAAEPGQLPLFPPAAAATARPHLRHARLRGRLQALLARSAAVAGEPPHEPRSSWPDSFFDVDEKP
jgi:hypothetical protein